MFDALSAQIMLTLQNKLATCLLAYSSDWSNGSVQQNVSTYGNVKLDFFSGPQVPETKF